MNAVASENPPLIDLSAHAGITVTLHAGTRTLFFGSDVTAGAAEPRTAGDLRGVIHAPDAVRADDVIYTVYRGVAPTASAAEIARRGLTFAALVLRSGTIAGDEWVRTRGHLNPSARRTSVALPEVHEVWSGSGLAYLQKCAEADCDEMVAVAIEPGDKVVVAPGWASLIANVGAAPLVLGSWRTQDSIPQHDELAALGGMAHFLLRDESGGDSLTRFAPNARYAPAAASPVPPRRLAPRDHKDFGLLRNEPMLRSFHRNPDFLRFMLRPQDYEKVWASLYRGDDSGVSGGDSV